MPFTHHAYSSPTSSPSPPESPMVIRHLQSHRSTRSRRTSRRSTSIPAPLPDPMDQPTIQPTQPTVTSPVDADSSIVLGDLVRSGEASRLRRRGAVRLDHASRSSIPNLPSNGPHASGSRAVLVGFGRPLDPDGDGLYTQNGERREEHEEPTWGNWSTNANSNANAPSGGALVQDELAAAADTKTDGPRYALYCGAPVLDDYDSDCDDDNDDGFRPAPFAWAARRSATPRTTGCGALVHTHAISRTTLPAWSARCAPTENVVSLPAQYALAELAARAARSACMCVREVVGCASCGNALGTRYIPCKAAATGLFAASACCRTTISDEEECMYTFLSSAVSAVPVPVPSSLSTSAASKPSLSSTSEADPRPWIHRDVISNTNTNTSIDIDIHALPSEPSPYMPTPGAPRIPAAATPPFATYSPYSGNPYPYMRGASYTDLIINNTGTTVGGTTSSPMHPAPEDVVYTLRGSRLLPALSPRVGLNRSPSSYSGSNTNLNVNVTARDVGAGASVGNGAGAGIGLDPHGISRRELGSGSPDEVDEHDQDDEYHGHDEHQEHDHVPSLVSTLASPSADLPEWARGYVPGFFDLPIGPDSNTDYHRPQPGLPHPQPQRWTSGSSTPSWSSPPPLASLPLPLPLPRVSPQSWYDAPSVERDVSPGTYVNEEEEEEEDMAIDDNDHDHDADGDAVVALHSTSTPLISSPNTVDAEAGPLPVLEGSIVPLDAVVHVVADTDDKTPGPTDGSPPLPSPSF